MVLAAVVGCSAPEARRAPAVAAPPAIAAPGLRLPDDVTPLRYELRLELDPDRDTFRGQVAIRLRVERPIERMWIHADELEITRATVDGAPLAALPVGGDLMRGVGFGRGVARGELGVGCG